MVGRNGSICLNGNIVTLEWEVVVCFQNQNQAFQYQTSTFIDEIRDVQRLYDLLNWLGVFVILLEDNFNIPKLYSRIYYYFSILFFFVFGQHFYYNFKVYDHKIHSLNHFDFNGKVVEINF